MIGNFDKCLEIVLKHEGGFVNHPKDPGGATNLGITKKVYEAWEGRDVDIEQIEDLTVDDVRPIYEKQYWNRMWCDDIPLGIDLMVFDFGVNAGPVRSIRFLQEVVHAFQDGIIGPETIQCAKAHHNPVLVITTLAQKRSVYYKSLSHYDTFGRGWDRRTRETTEAALSMV